MVGTVTQTANTAAADATFTMSLTVRRIQVDIAATCRGGGDDLVLLVHGLGCNRTSWGTLPIAEGMRWIAIDLPGHGDSPRASWTGDTDALRFIADVITAVVRRCRTPRTRMIHFVGHSMGGAAVVIAACALPRHELGAVVAIEGNLTGEDCAMVSRPIAAQSAVAFRHRGHQELQLRLAVSDRDDLRTWGSWLANADADTVHPPPSDRALRTLSHADEPGRSHRSARRGPDGRASVSMAPAATANALTASPLVPSR